jgi:carboxyl-terminal processing protease
MKKAFLMTVLVLALMSPGLTQVDAASSETYRQLNLFGDVFERVRAEYVEEVTDEELIEAAIRGMLTSLDPHSSYLSPENFDEMQVQTRGEFGGLGIEVTMEDGFVKVVSPIDDTPADRAGIMAGDYITHLDGEGVLGLTLGDAVEKMRGPVNTDIVLTVVREGADEPLEITVTRDIITIKSVRWQIEDKVGYIRISSFTENTEDGLINAIESIDAELGADLQGYVVDLRNNPGGLLDQAIAVSDVFLDKGEIVSTRGRREDSTQRFNARPGDLANGLPVVVLINSGSASASEIVAGALQDHQRAIIMGTQSFGKGSVQTIIPLPGHGAMRLTTARYYTPSGVSIQATGISPDIIVEAALVEVEEVDGLTSEAELRNSLDGDDHEEAVSARSEEALADYQLGRALDLLQGLALISAMNPSGG